MYTPDTGRAERYFDEAQVYCSDTGNDLAKRERGRILKNWGALKLIIGDFSRAHEHLKSAHALSQAVGDRRRVFSNELYQSILSYKLGKKDEALESLLGVIRNLHSLRDGRYFVPALMTFEELKTGHAKSGLSEIIRNSQVIPEEIQSALAYERLEVYSNFWVTHFSPTFLYSAS